VDNIAAHEVDDRDNLQGEPLMRDHLEGPFHAQDAPVRAAMVGPPVSSPQLPVEFLQSKGKPAKVNASKIGFISFF
jgi:hypothetical protein